MEQASHLHKDQDLGLLPPRPRTPCDSPQAALTHELGEASQGQAAGPRDELQQTHPHLIVRLLHKLTGQS